MGMFCNKLDNSVGVDGNQDIGREVAEDAYDNLQFVSRAESDKTVTEGCCWSRGGVGVKLSGVTSWSEEAFNQGFGVSDNLGTALPGEKYKGRERWVFEHLSECNFIIMKTINRTHTGVNEQVISFAASLNNDFPSRLSTEGQNESKH